MKFWITINDDQTHELDLPVSDELTWEDFVNLKQVRALGLPVTDVTPETVLVKRSDTNQPDEVEVSEDF